MNQFVILFRLNPDQLDETALLSRTQETRVWAQRLNASGHKLSPCILGPESHWSGPDGASRPALASGVGPVTALLFLEAGEFPQAVEIARTHPALRYGATIEVRPWARPAAPQPADVPRAPNP